MSGRLWGTLVLATVLVPNAANATEDVDVEPLPAAPAANPPATAGSSRSEIRLGGGGLADEAGSCDCQVVSRGSGRAGGGLGLALALGAALVARRRRVGDGARELA